MLLTITTDDLLDHEACLEGIEDFETVFGDEMTVEWTPKAQLELMTHPILCKWYSFGSWSGLVPRFRIMNESIRDKKLFEFGARAEDWIRTMWEKCAFINGTFTESALDMCKFSKCEFDGSRFSRNFFSCVRFEGCSFEHSDFSNNIGSATFYDCHFNKTIFLNEKYNFERCSGTVRIETDASERNIFNAYTIIPVDESDEFSIVDGAIVSRPR